MRWVILIVSIGLCGCGTADDEFRVLSYTPAGIEYSVWTGAHSREAVADMAQQYCQREGKKAQIIDSETAEKNLFKGPVADCSGGDAAQKLSESPNCQFRKSAPLEHYCASASGLDVAGLGDGTLTSDERISCA